MQLQLSNRTVSHLLHGDETYAVQTLLTISEPQIGLEPIRITLRTVIALPFETYCGYKLDFHQLLHLTEVKLTTVLSGHDGGRTQG